MIGSIYALWPFWEYKKQNILNTTFLMQTNLRMPSFFESLLSFIFVLLGFFVIYIIKKQSKEKKYVN